MSNEEKNAGSSAAAAAAIGVPQEQPSPDEHTTAPNPAEPAETAAPQKAVSGNWQMPKPKFQQTSGYLPQGYLKDIGESEPAKGSEDTTQEQAVFVPLPPTQQAATPNAAVEPQPDLTDEMIPDDPAAAVSEGEVQAKSGSGVTMAVLAIIGVILFLVVFLAAVYFLLVK